MYSFAFKIETHVLGSTNCYEICDQITSEKKETKQNSCKIYTKSVKPQQKSYHKCACIF